MPERRVAELAAALELAREEPRDVVPRRVRDRARVGLEGLDDHAAGRVSAAAAGELRDELEGALLGAEVGQAEARVGVDDRGERDARRSGGPWRPSACRAARRAPRAANRPSASASAAGRAIASASRRMRSSSGTWRSSSRSSRCVPAPIRASSGEPQAGHVSGAGSCVTAVVAAERLVAVQRRARRRSSGSAASPRSSRQWSAGATPRRLSSRIALPPSLGDRAELLEQRRRERIAALAAQVDDLARAAAGPRCAPPSSRRSSDAQLSGRGVALP